MKISIGATAVLGGILFLVTRVSADDPKLHARLIGFHEVPANSTIASGEFKATLIDNTTIYYELTYSGLEGVVTQAHIHFGQRFVAGGISLWLCQIPADPVVNPPNANPADPTGLAPLCPQTAQEPTTVKGSLTFANLVGPLAQGIDGSAATRTPEEFAEIVKAIRAGLAYANVHSVKFSSGEIRGQIRVVNGNDHHREHDEHRGR
jgi:CHRD domain-containing protein